MSLVSIASRRRLGYEWGWIRNDAFVRQDGSTVTRFAERVLYADRCEGSVSNREKGLESVLSPYRWCLGSVAVEPLLFGVAAQIPEVGASRMKGNGVFGVGLR